LLDIVNADGKVTVGEAKYFEQLQRVLGISNSEIEEAKYMSVAGSLSIIRDMLPAEKHALAIMMLEMIRADGEVDDEETKVFIAVCAMADIKLPEAVS
jgi:uncharacterized tellurite resistance protein B-like protein